MLVTFFFVKQIILIKSSLKHKDLVFLKRENYVLKIHDLNTIVI